MRNKILGTAVLGIAAASALAAGEAGPTFKVSGYVDFEAAADWVPDADDDRLSHSYKTTFDLFFDVKFNEKWSAEVAIEASDYSYAPTWLYDGGFVRYAHSEDFVITAGDQKIYEGVFRYYGYDDPVYDAIGMRKHYLRGLRAYIYGVDVALGFTTTSTTGEDIYDETGWRIGEGSYAYNAHLAYNLELGRQKIRPFLDYKSYQEKDHNELHAGAVANLAFGEGFALQVGYGLQYAYLASDDDETSVINHAFAVEPEATFGPVFVNASFYYSILDDDEELQNLDLRSNPEYLFAYLEPGFKFNDIFSAGVTLEYHTNSVDDDDELETFDFGPRLYFSPANQLDFTGYVLASVPLGDDAGDDTTLEFGIETEFTF